jgi:hypothetical protein
VFGVVICKICFKIVFGVVICKICLKILCVVIVVNVIMISNFCLVIVVNVIMILNLCLVIVVNVIMILDLWLVIVVNVIMILNLCFEYCCKRDYEIGFVFGVAGAESWFGANLAIFFSQFCCWTVAARNATSHWDDGVVQSSLSNDDD